MSSQTETAQLLLNAQRIRAGVLLAIVGAVLGAAGSILAGVELAQASRKWLADSGYNAEMARTTVHHAVHASRAARQAAREAWLHNGADAPSEVGV